LKRKREGGGWGGAAALMSVLNSGRRDAFLKALINGSILITVASGREHKRTQRTSACWGKKELKKVKATPKNRTCREKLLPAAG